MTEPPAGAKNHTGKKSRIDKSLIGSEALVHKSLTNKVSKNKVSKLSETSQTKIQIPLRQETVEEMSLRDLRVSRKLTQEKLAKSLKIRQEGVSRLEKRSDLHVSTLRQFVKAMGGELRLIVEFPDRPPVVLSDFQALEQELLEQELDDS